MISSPDEIFNIILKYYGKKYATIYLYLFKNKHKILSFKYYITRLHLTRIEHFILSLRFPKIKNLSYGSFVDSIELSQLTNVIYVKTIQKNGGGSARCMIAEIF